MHNPVIFLECEKVFVVNMWKYQIVLNIYVKDSSQL